MIMRKGLAAFVASSVALGSTAAAASTASVDNVRQPAGVAEAENMGGMGLGWLVALVVAAGVALVIIEDDDDEDPVSP